MCVFPRRLEGGIENIGARARGDCELPGLGGVVGSELRSSGKAARVLTVELLSQLCPSSHSLYTG